MSDLFRKKAVKDSHIQIRISKEQKEEIKKVAKNKGFAYVADYLLSLVDKDINNNKEDKE
jgi:predicted DNA binding CopG/RHH family protein